MEKRIRKTAICVKCGKMGEIQAFGECISCYNARRRTKKKFEWSYSHPFCVVCKTTKYKHHAKGICEKCRNTHDLTYIKLRIKWNIIKKTPERLKKKRLKDKRWRIRTPKKQELYKATQRGISMTNGTKQKIKEDIKIIKKEIARLKKLDFSFIIGGNI